ncbi:MAG: carboxylase [Bacteroides sp.]|jgi:oxaloacetate decarboxylase alpha subunit/pyruvate carboxylase subunit B|nr:carboxylase [Bacteroides sp.]
MNKTLKIRDLTLRDGQQSLFATRMTQAQVDRVLPLYKKAGFYAMEVWGGAVPDSVMRYLNEDPWERLEKIKAAIGDTSKLTALSRGRNLFGYNPYPDTVIEGFNRNAVQSGIDIMRIFDALNDTSNITSTIKFVKENGGLADCTVCYTVDPKFRNRDRILGLLKGKPLPGKVFTIEYFVRKAQELERMGADMITIKDMAGLIPPVKSGIIIKLMKEEVGIPINFHTHSTPGYGLASVLTAILNGVDVVDTCILNFAGGPAGPSFEIVQLFCNKLGIDTGVNLEAVVEINRELKEIRKELIDYDSYQIFPIDFDITKDQLPKEIDALFDRAIELASERKERELLATTQAIEHYFNFPPPNENVRTAEIPGGMYTNMLAQLKQLKLEKLLPRVLEIIPTVRLAAGLPPLVTPTSQIVGVQAVNCVIDENNGKPFYNTNSVQFVNLVKGLYGKTPIPIDPAFRKQITGSKKETPYDPKDYKKQDNPVLEEFGGVHLAQNEKEELLLELFPSVATTFLSNQIEQRHLAGIRALQEEKRRKYEAEKAEYEKLSPEEKEKRLQEGLYSYKWTSFHPGEEDTKHED